MKYKIIKDLPLAKIGEEVSVDTGHEGGECLIITQKGRAIVRMKESDIQEWLEPIVEKKTYDDLKLNDDVYVINSYGMIAGADFNSYCRSETFLTREEAEDEHARRELAVRKGRFVPKEGELYYYPSSEGEVKFSHNELYPTDCLMINAGLSFRTRQACQDAIDNNDILRLFYTIR